MAVISRAGLKALFITGYVPTQSDWEDVFDSYLHQNDTLNIPVELVKSDTFALLPAGETDKLYLVRDKGDGNPGIYEWNGSAYVLLADVAAGGGGASLARTTLSDAAISVTVNYFGASAPTLAGSAGVYTVTLPAGTKLSSARVAAADAGTATDGSGNFTMTFDSADGIDEYTNTEITALSDSTKVNNLIQRGMSVTEAGNGSGQVTTAFNSIESGVGAFSIQFNA
jgi:hypothetical protein